MINQVFSRLKLLFAKGKVLRIGADTVQVRVLDEETLSNIERVEPYGFSYRPLPGCQGYLLFPEGDRSYGVAIVIGDKQFQMDLQPGEVAMHDDQGNYAKIRRDGVIEVKASTKVLADTPLFETTQDAKIGGNLLVMGQQTANGGYYGVDGTAARMHSGAVIDNGLAVTGHQTCNGKNISDTHTHNYAGGTTAGVN